MGFIKRWRKIIIVIVVFVGILSLVATSLPPEESEAPTPAATPTPAVTAMLNMPLPATHAVPAPTPIPAKTSAPTTPPTMSSETEEDVTQEQVCALGHDFYKNVWETVTCLKGGYYNNVCKKCGLVESVTEEPLPHNVEDLLMQEGNCMQDTVIRHICKSCGQQVASDTRYTPQVHKWTSAVVDGSEIFYCEWCGVVQ